MRTSLALTHVAFLSLATLSGCLTHTRTEVDAGNDTSSPSDAAPRPVDGCLCVDGAPGPCDPMRAAGVGLCDVELGYMWNGSTCQALSACSCEGADCAQLAPSEVVCLERHRICPRACGATFAGPLPACLLGEYCDYPVCGGDDGLGACTPTPDACGPGPVCGCDGITYANLCEAAIGGVPVARHTACDAPSYRFAQLRTSCGPTDGPAWSFTLTPGPLPCEPLPTSERLEFEIWTELNREPSETTYTLGGFGSAGSARVCSGASACTNAEGTVRIHFFASGEVTRFDYDLTTDDGRRFVETNLEGTNWCRLVGPGCG